MIIFQVPPGDLGGMRDMTTHYKINDTSAYHRNRLNTLGWELTMCNALEDPASPCREVIQKNDTFGMLLTDFLSTIFPLDAISSILEVGGGYGFLMRDVLSNYPCMHAAMIELSPVLMNKQRETLRDFSVEFISQDFFDVDISLLDKFDMALLNEVAGDFPVLCDVDPRCLEQPDCMGDPWLARAKNFFTACGLDVPPHPFNLNLGAIEAVEKMCKAGVRYIYLSEHSSEAGVPEELQHKIIISSTGNPERIRLAGHDEYTMRFSYLQRVAEREGYRTIRGCYRDFIPFEPDGRLNFILTSNSQNETHEMIRQFIGDLFKYEYILCIRNQERGEDSSSRFLCNRCL
jgi:hypothetical protein